MGEGSTWNIGAAGSGVVQGDTVAHGSVRNREGEFVMQPPYPPSGREDLIEHRPTQISLMRVTAGVAPGYIFGGFLPALAPERRERYRGCTVAATA